MFNVRLMVGLALLCQFNVKSEEKFYADSRYEEENACVVIDAALNSKGQIYFFDKDQYLRLDGNGEEDEVGNIQDIWPQVPFDLNAAVEWKSPKMTFFLKENFFYRYTWRSFGPFQSGTWGAFFKEPVDAVGKHRGQAYFFRGCKVSITLGASPSDSFVGQSEWLNFPCDPDAAFSIVNTLYVIKRDQVWRMAADAEVATGPESLSTVAKLHSWKVCDE